MRDLLTAYVMRPLMRPLTRLLVRATAAPAFRAFFRRVSTPERLNEEFEKDLAEWFGASLVLLLATANMEILIWQNLFNLIHWRSFQVLLDKHEWLGLGLRLMLAVAVVQAMPDQDLFSLIHPGPRRPHLAGRHSRWQWIKACWKPVGLGLLCQHLSRSSPVFAILAVILDGTVGWVCYGFAVVQYLIIGLVTSRDRAADVLRVFDAEMAARRRELARQVSLIDGFAEDERDPSRAPVDAAGHPSCGD
jgi:hypothetical protein